MALSILPIPRKLSLLIFWTILCILLFQKKESSYTFNKMTISMMMMIIMVSIEQNTFPYTAIGQVLTTTSNMSAQIIMTIETKPG